MHIVVAGETSEQAAQLQIHLAARGRDWGVSWLQLGDGPTPHLDALAPDALVCFSGTGWNRCNLMMHELRERFPLAARVVLVPDPQGEEMMQALDAAHRVLPEPFDPVALIDAIDDIVELRSLLDDARVKQAIEQSGPLPAAPKQYLSLSRLLRDDSTQAADLVEVVTQDPALAARVLRLSNSAYYSGGREISDLRMAVVRLGQDALRRLVLASEVFSSGPGVDEVRERALRISRLADQILPEAGTGVAATAGLLSQVGRLLPPLELHEPDGPTLLPHSVAGAYLLGLWGLPATMIEAVAWHQAPARAGTLFWVAGAVHVAAALIDGSEVDTAYLSRVRRLHDLPRWRAMADAEQALAQA
ncbi:HDOD domain-containing protein [Pseudoxanthomonas sp. X-1]|uniref:HDOD domain-containing protein n=1 Tax=Pseudoxanthomonas sp. X-1 TaxID=2571115 RepID=UPI00110B578B|nr:HDOD domain-containing protein [Pseudoxanthomonas sp. X-1]TMN19186.1 HDOD domain-containing protein [Pseudoxanthomonas sp. X-1]UAY74041.1 HDOD domain-containing protein [Pseudoxanthomonas sp. X-1]